MRTFTPKLDAMCAPQDLSVNGQRPRGEYRDAVVFDIDPTDIQNRPPVN